MAELSRLRVPCCLGASTTELHEGTSFGVEACDVTIGDSFPDDAEGCLGAEVVFVVERVHHLHNILGSKAGIFDVSHLVAAAILHLLASDKASALDEIEELGAGKGMSDRDLDGFAIKFLSELDGVADRSLGFTWQAEDEIAVYEEAKVMTVLDEVTGALDRGTLLDVLENLGIAGLEANDQQPATRLLHGLERVIVAGNTGVAGPGEPERFQPFAKLNGAGLLDIEGIVVEKELLDLREEFLGLLHLCHNVIGGALAPSVAREGLRPETEGALRRTATSGV